jgi:hypothetical protein
VTKLSSAVFVHSAAGRKLHHGDPACLRASPAVCRPNKRTRIPRCRRVACRSLLPLREIRASRISISDPHQTAPPPALSIISKRNPSSQRPRWRRNGRRRSTRRRRRRTSRTACSATTATTSRWTRRRRTRSIPNHGRGASGACALVAFFPAPFLFSCPRRY